MFRRSLTAKVLIAVGLTVAGVIGIYSYFVIRVQSTWWIERTEAQNVISATLVREYIEGVMLSERHDEVAHFLGELKKSNEIIAGRVATPDGRVVFSTETQEVGHVALTIPPTMFDEGNRVLHGVRRVDGENVAVAMAPVQSRPSCTRCHGQTSEHLGVIVLEKSLAPAEASIANNRNLLLVYGLIIFVLVSVVLWLLIVRLISQPVAEVLEQMQRVERGDLAARAGTERVDEIGQLERGFDGMVESLETAKRELHESHEKQMQQAGKLATIGELASGIAHEIRNPLAGIGAAVEVLAESNPGNAQFSEIAGEMRRQVHRLNTTLRDLLDFARQREPEIVPCDVCAQLRPMLALIRSDAQKNHVAIVEQCPADLPPVCADAQQMQQALLNVTDGESFDGTPTPFVIDYSDPAGSGAGAGSGTGILPVQAYLDGTNVTGSLVFTNGQAIYNFSDTPSAGDHTWSVTVTDAAGNSNTVAATFTVAVVTPLAITAQPSAQTVCDGQPASFSVAAVGEDLHYSWRNSNQGWGGGGWVVSNGDGWFWVENDANYGGAFGVPMWVTWAGYGWSSDAIRPFGDALSVGQTFQVDVEAMDAENGLINAGGLVGFDLRDAGNTNRLEFVANGDNATYTLVDAGGARDTGVSLTNQAVHVEVMLTGTNTYAMSVSAIAADGSHGSPLSFTGTLAGTADSMMDRVRLFDDYSNVPVTEAYAFFNNLVVGDKTDNASNAAYASGVLNNGADGGTAPIPGAADTNVFTIAAVNDSDAGSYDVIVSGSGSNLISQAATLTLGIAPAIQGSPQSQTNCAGQTVTLSVSATGTDLNYQWRKDGQPLANATDRQMPLYSVTASDAGSYDVVVSNACGEATSAAAAVVVRPALVMTAAPVDQTVLVGGAASFVVTATGNNPTYQWRKNGAAMAGATNATLTIAPAQLTDAGNYDVVVIDVCGSFDPGAALTINPLATLNVAGGTTLTNSQNALVLQFADGTDLSSLHIYIDGVEQTGSFSVAQGQATDTVTLLNGDHTLEVVVADQNGHVSDTSTAFTIAAPLPEITGTVIPTPNTNGWNNTDVVVSFSAPGAASLSPSSPVSVTGEVANVEVDGIAMDSIGNVETNAVFVSIDKTPPNITGLLPGQGGTHDLSYPLLVVQYADQESGDRSQNTGVASGLNLDSLAITLIHAGMTNDVTTNFNRFASGAVLSTNLAQGVYTWTVSIADYADNLTTTSVTFYATGAINPAAPVMSGLDVPSDYVLMPDAPELWLQGTVVSGQGTGGSATVYASVNAGASVPMNQRDGTFGYLLPLDYGTNVVVLAAADTNGNVSARVIIVERSDRYQAAITSPSFGAFANGSNVTVTGYVSQQIDAGTDQAASLQAVWVLPNPATGGQPVATTLTGPDADGRMSFTTVTPVPTVNFCVPVPVLLSNCWANATGNFSTAPPLGLVEGYEITHKDQLWTWRNTHEGTLFTTPLSSLGNEIIDEYHFESPCGGNQSNVWTRSSFYVTTTTQSWDCVVPPVDADGLVWLLLGTGTTNWYSQVQPGLALTPDPMPVGDWWLTTGALNFSGRGLSLGKEWHGSGAMCDQGCSIGTEKNDYEGQMKFHAPFQYASGTTVVLTFEGMALQGAYPQDMSQLSQVKLIWQGQALTPVAVVTNTDWQGNVQNARSADLSYVVSVDGGKEYTLDATSFDWPTNTFTFTDNCGTTTTTNHTLSFTGWYNQKEADSLYVIPIIGSKCYLQGGNTGLYSQPPWADGGSKVSPSTRTQTGKAQSHIILNGKTDSAWYCNTVLTNCFSGVPLDSGQITVVTRGLPALSTPYQFNIAITNSLKTLGSTAQAVISIWGVFQTINTNLVPKASTPATTWSNLNFTTNFTVNVSVQDSSVDTLILQYVPTINLRSCNQNSSAEADTTITVTPVKP